MRQITAMLRRPRRRGPPREAASTGLRHVHHQQLPRALRFEGEPARDGVVKRGSEGIDVRAEVDWVGSLTACSGAKCTRRCRSGTDWRAMRREAVRCPDPKRNASPRSVTLAMPDS